MIRISRLHSKNYRGGKCNLDDAALLDNSGNRLKTVDCLDLHHARQKAYRLLALRPHSVQELEKKLRGRGFPAVVIKEALEKLAELKYLDDASFATQWTRNLAINKLWGNRKIVVSLQEKGIAAPLIDAAIKEIRSEMPEEEAVVLLLKKSQTGKKDGQLDIKERKRILQKLLGRGFPAGLILNKLGKIPEEDFHGEDGQ